jgi:hypothetical protein
MNLARIYLTTDKYVCLCFQLIFIVVVYVDFASLLPAMFWAVCPVEMEEYHEDFNGVSRISGYFLEF